MTLDEANQRIQSCMRDMNDRYGRILFDEWAVVSPTQQPPQILAYSGPRRDVFLKNFNEDLGALRAELVQPKYRIGDFEFARHATGTCFEVFMVLGRAIYLICNHTRASMNEIAKDPRWLSAQVPFAEFAETIRTNPVLA